MILVLAVMAGLQADIDPACLFDGGCGPAPAAVMSQEDRQFLEKGREDVRELEELRRQGLNKRDPVAGLKKGASEGALLGFLAVEYPAIELVSEGWGREMSRSADGPGEGNGNGTLYTVAGIVLGALLYIPALALGLVGGALGAVAGSTAETLEPGATSGWDSESLFD